LNLENIIYIMEVIFIIFLLFKFIPKSEVYKAHVAFLSTQVITWLIGLVASEYMLVEYPIRMFSYSNKANFLFEFFLLPCICALFIVNYPEKKSAFSRFMHYFYYCTSLTICEVVEERYTNILKYIHWNWYLSWITLFITFYLARKYCSWFFKKIRIIN